MAVFAPAIAFCTCAYAQAGLYSAPIQESGRAHVALSFGDAVQPAAQSNSGEAYSLNAMLAAALENNPGLATKRKELLVAEGELKQASIYFQNNPVLSAWIARRHVPGETNVDSTVTASVSPPDLQVPPFLSGLGGGNNQQTLGGNLLSIIGSGVDALNNRPLGFSADHSLSRTESEDSTDFGFEVAQEFEVFGQPKARRMAAQANLDAKLAEIAAAASDVLLETRRAYYGLQIAELRLKIVDEQSQYIETIRELLNRQFEAGDIARTELRQQEIQASLLVAEKHLAESVRDSARGALRLSAGFDAGAAIPVEAALPGPATVDRDLLAEIVSANPKLEQARAATEYRANQARLVRAESRPNITGRAFWTREEDEIDIVGGGLSIPVPLFNRGQGNIAAARAQVDVAESNYAAERQRLEHRADEALNRYESTLSVAATYHEEIIPMIEKNLAALEKAFEAGDISLVDLRFHQRELLGTQKAALDVLGEHYAWRAELEGLLGRDLSDLTNATDGAIQNDE